jgi:hypothetical protein
MTHFHNHITTKPLAHRNKHIGGSLRVIIVELWHKSDKAIFTLHVQATWFQDGIGSENAIELHVEQPTEHDNPKE